MTALLATGTGGFAQLIAILVVFVLVLGVTAWTTKWIANYQKQQGNGGNVELIETSRIGNNKYIQIVRVGEKYLAIAICKDTVTVLCEIPKEQITTAVIPAPGFKELFDKVLKKEADDSNKPKDDVHEE